MRGFTAPGQAPISIKMEGFFTDTTLGMLPEQSGVYAVYGAGILSDGPQRLLYIGEAQNLRERVIKHERRPDWEKENVSLFRYSSPLA